MQKRWLIIAVILAAGCQTAPRKDARSPSSTADALSSASTVAEAITGQKMDTEQLKSLGRKIQTDPQARSAAKAVTESLSVLQTGIKYCPKDGKRFSATLTTCPEHGVTLLPLEE